MLWLLPFAAIAAPRPDSVASVDGTTLPIRCHVEREADDWRCGEVLEILADLYTMAWIGDDPVLPPLVPDGDLGGSDALDVYLGYEAEGPGTVDVFCDGADGCDDGDPNDGRSGATVFLRVDLRTEPDTLRRGLAPALAKAAWLATDADETAEGFVTGTAAAMAMVLLDDPAGAVGPEDVPVPAVADFQEFPWVSSLLQGSDWLYEEHGFWTDYGAGALFWASWADAEMGFRGPPAKEWWEAAAQPAGAENEPDVLDAWNAISYLTWEDALLDIAAQRALAGTDRTPTWLPPGQPALRAWREEVLDGIPAEVTPSYAPYPLGMSIWDLFVEANAPLALDVHAENGERMAIVLVDPTGVPVSFRDETPEDDLHVDYAPGATGLLVVVVVNLGPEGFDADDPLAPAPFTLTIRPSLPEVADPTPTTATCGCSGGPGSLALLLLPFWGRRRQPRQPRSFCSSRA